MVPAAYIQPDCSSHLSMPTQVNERSYADFASNEATSGGYFVNLYQLSIDATGAIFTKLVPVNDTELSDISKAITHIENVFGLNRSQVASTLFVTRKTIYNWRDGVVSPHDSSWERINFLNEVAEYYINQEPENRVGKLKVMINGVSIHQLLLDKSAKKEDFITFINQLSDPHDAEFHKVANANAAKALKTRKTRPTFS